MLDIQETHSLSEFLRNYKAHIADLKETRTPKVLTVNGRAEVVILDAESYQGLVEKIRHVEEVAAVRTLIAQAEKDGEAHEEVLEAEIERSQAIMRELVEETERLGLYR